MDEVGGTGCGRRGNQEPQPGPDVDQVARQHRLASDGYRAEQGHRGIPVNTHADGLQTQQQLLGVWVYRLGMRWRGLRLMTSGVVVQAWQTVRGEGLPPKPRALADAPAAPQVVAQAIQACHSKPDPNAANPPSHLPLPPRCYDDRLKQPPQLYFTACAMPAIHFAGRKSKIRKWQDRISSASTRRSLDPTDEDLSA